MIEAQEKKKEMKMNVKMKVNIETGIPLPESRGVVVQTLEKMNHGDSIVIPLEKVNTWRSLASKNKIGVVTRKVSDTEIRIWRVKRPKE